MHRMLLLVALAFAALPAGAHAATVQLTTVGHTEGHMPGLIPDGVAIGYVAAPGEANRFTVARLGDQLLISDIGATIQPIAPRDGAGAGQCTPVNATSVTCPLALQLSVDLGDANDTATVGALGTTRLDYLQIDGGSGDDVLTGGERAETLIGGDGADRVLGGDGDDRLIGTEAVAGDDMLDGGSGRNVLAYTGQRDDIHVDLAARRATGTGIGTDTLASFAEVQGGRGDDELVGDDGPNLLAGGPGDDFVRGAGGNDELWGERPDAESPGTRDRVDGGPGNDLINLGHEIIDPGDIELIPYTVEDGRKDRVRCGTGRDVVTFAGAQDVLPVDCEDVSPGDGWSLELPPLAATSRSLVLAKHGFQGRPELVAADGKTVLGRVAAPIKASDKQLRFVLTPTGRRIAAHGRPTVVRVEFGVLTALTLALPKL